VHVRRKAVEGGFNVGFKSLLAGAGSLEVAQRQLRRVARNPGRPPAARAPSGLVMHAFPSEAFMSSRAFIVGPMTWRSSIPGAPHLASRLS
jgi:hypothetical protein